MVLSMLVAIFAGCTGAVAPAAPAGGAAAGTEAAPAAGATEAAAAGEPVTLQFSQWWEPELPAGEFRKLMDEFEAANPGIKVELVSGPYAATKEQDVAGAAAGTMSDVVGLDGAWVADFVKQGSLADMSALMKDAGYDPAELAAQIQIDGKTYMIPVVNFVYPLFTNLDLLKKAGIDKAPSNQTEFADAAKKLTDPATNVSGWVLPLSMELPNGVQNDILSLLGASGGSMLKDGKPNLVDNPKLREVLEYIKGLYDAGVIAPGAFTMKEPDKVAEFTNGRVAMMVDTLAHINMIRKQVPDLNFTVSALPAADDYTGKRGMPYASWGIGVAANSKHPAEAWKLVQFLMSKDTNSKLSTIANAFPGNVNSAPDLSKADKLFTDAFEIYKQGYVFNEFTGLPVAEQLQRDFDEQFQLYLDGGQTLDEMLQKTQDAWMKSFQ